MLPPSPAPSPAYPGNTYRPFTDLIALESLNPTTFRSIAPPFSPGGVVGTGRAYGGHVFMQAAWAACQTVDERFLLHACHFLLPGLTHIPFTYKVHNLRDGRSYSTRLVTVTQTPGKGICFASTCSFKKAETSPLDVQEERNIWKKYARVLGGKRPTDFPECPGIDTPWYWARRRQTGINEPFPGLQMHMPDMTAQNSSLHPLDRRQLICYRTLGDLPRNPNLHLCAHLYASDRNSLFIVANHFDLGDRWTQMGTLVHTVVFHTGMEDLWFEPPPQNASSSSPLDDDEGRWFCKEDSSDRVAGGRGMFRSQVWAANGRHVATIMQEGMIRVTNSAVASEAEVRVIEGVEAGWKARL
ncbi:hypothetical protein LTR62_000263 [Meristemomyces frigidus]|uniref:Thioesterase/thiol ester dehydrase-isomerase n=1 Tax=Meristemomyces frigidus TaxID=1508187 RepID=A0AAN7YNT2_9PEZI|nr:hypothetical protein LTR62_000263 [Meristemomyces frigidus]